jgi:hypothetical protein
MVLKFVDNKQIHYLTSATCFDSLCTFEGYHSTTSLSTLLVALFSATGKNCDGVNAKMYLEIAR